MSRCHLNIEKYLMKVLRLGVECTLRCIDFHQWIWYQLSLGDVGRKATERGEDMADAKQIHEVTPRVDRLVEIALQNSKVRQGIIATLYRTPMEGIDGRCAAEILRLKLYTTIRIESDEPLCVSPKLRTHTTLSEEVRIVLSRRYHAGAFGLYPVP